MNAFPLFDPAQVLADAGIAALNPGAHDSAHGWSATAGRASFAAVDPATEDITARIAGADSADLQRVLHAAVLAQRRWRNVPAPRRGELVRRIGEKVAARLETLAAVVALDTGKSLAEARAELREVVDMANLAAGQSRMLAGATQQSQRERHRMYEQWLPLGVVGVISAYNFPAAVWAQNGFLAAIGGNAVVWKPSPKVPLTAIALQQLAQQAMDELDCPGVFSLLIPDDDAVAAQLVADRRVALISFTGSSRVGTQVAQVVAAMLGRRVMLECSGNNGCIVDETADLALAARSITFGAVGTTGQRCTSTRRVIALRSIAPRLIELMKHAFEQVSVGDPRDPAALVGPLVDRAAVGQFEAAVAQAVALGGRVVCGGRRIARPGWFVEPTIIANARSEWPCVQHETFAPIVYVIEVDTLEEAIEVHNGVPQGLASGIHSDSLVNVETFLSAAGSDCGIAKVNMGTTGADVGAAFGGEKETGGGRTAGSDAWKGYMRRQSVCINWSNTSPWDKLITL